MTDLIVSCHLCCAQVEVTKTHIVMATKSGRLVPAEVERLRRRHGVSPYQWVRICLACNKEERE